MVGKATPGRPLGRTVSGRNPLLVRARRSPLKALVALFLLCALCVAGPPAKLDDRAAWREACAVSRYSCRGLRPPLVVEAPITGLLGRYRMGDKYLVIHDELDSKLAYAVKVHEMVHYLQYKRSAWKFTHENACAMEREAFEVSNVVLRRIGDPRVVDWNIMRVVYGCP